MNDVSDTLLKQRLRNRIIESLETFVDTSSVEKLGTDEIIELWYDFAGDADEEDRLGFFDEPVFSQGEIASLKDFCNLIDSTYKDVPTSCNYADLAENRAWKDLDAAAAKELEVFMIRGMLSEEHEVE